MHGNFLSNVSSQWMTHSFIHSGRLKFYVMTTIIFVTLNVRLIKPFSVRSHTNKKLVQSIKIHTTSLKPNERKKLTLFVSLSFFLCLDLRLSHFHYPTLVCLAVFLNAPFLCSLSVVWLIKVSFITRSLFVCLSVCLSVFHSQEYDSNSTCASC